MKDPVVPTEVDEVIAETNTASAHLSEPIKPIPAPSVVKIPETAYEISPEKPPEPSLTPEPLNPSKPAPRIFIRLLRGASFPFFLAWSLLTFPFRFIWNRLRRKNSP